MPVADLRPLSTGELLDKTFSLYRSHFGLFVGIMAVPGVIPMALGTFFEMVAINAGPSAGSNSSFGFIVVAAIMVGIAYALLYAMALAATVFAVSEMILGRDTTFLQAYVQVRGKALRTLWILIALGLAIGLGFLLLIIPGVLVAVTYAVAIPAAIVENLKTGAAFRRSETLTKGRRGNIFLIFVLFLVLNYIALIVFDVPSELLQGLWPGVTSLILKNLATFLSGALVGPFLTISLSLMYFDLRIRKEGFDLQLMLSSLTPEISAPLAT